MSEPAGPPVIGIDDSSGAEAVRSEQVAASLRRLFRRYGFTPVVPPVLESAVPFLDRSGEDIRRHMYIFTDPGGRELCLRPELTIPTVGLYGRRGPDAPTELRAYYVGPAFRYAAPADGGARQLTHAGVELLGAADTELADAEVLALARASLVEHGVTPGRLVVSDIGFLQAAVLTDLLSDRSRAALARAAGDPDDLATVLDRAAQGPSDPDEGSELDALVAQLPAAQRAELLDRIIGGLEPETLGVRTPAEIAARLVSRSTARPAEPVPEPVDRALPRPAGRRGVAGRGARPGGRPRRRAGQPGPRRPGRLVAAARRDDRRLRHRPRHGDPAARPAPGHRLLHVVHLRDRGPRPGG